MSCPTLLDTIIIDEAVAHAVDDAEAADTQRMVRKAFDIDAPPNPDATSFYDLRPPAPSNTLEKRRRRRLICEAEECIKGLREALTTGWDVGPELAYEERRLATLLENG